MSWTRTDSASKEFLGDILSQLTINFVLSVLTWKDGFCLCYGAAALHRMRSLG